LSGAGCGKTQEQAAPTPAGPSAPGGDSDKAKPKVDLAKASPDVTTDAESWHAEWKKDAEAARKKYKGKIVELSGVVEHPDDDPYGRIGYIWLKAKSDILGPRCALDDTAPWLKVGPGCTIKIRGTVPDFGLSGDLYPCVIVESSPTTCLEITAARLAKEFAADKKAALDKYEKKWLIVEGELTGKEPSKIDEGRFIYLTLKGDGAVNVRCYIANNSDYQRKANEDLEVGQKMKVCGELGTDAKGTGPQISLPGSRKVTLIP
jgi:hypothetical protein